jgi:hypothetical protein
MFVPIHFIVYFIEYLGKILIELVDLLVNYKRQVIVILEGNFMEERILPLSQRLFPLSQSEIENLQKDADLESAKVLGTHKEFEVLFAKDKLTLFGYFLIIKRPDGDYHDWAWGEKDEMLLEAEILLNKDQENK